MTTLVRKPLLCLDTNASIDIGIVDNLQREGKSLDMESDRTSESWKKVFYDEAMRWDVEKKLKDRLDQLRGAARFLRIARHQSCIRLPEFVSIEHRRVRSDKASMPQFPVEETTPHAHSLSLKIFSETTLSLADSLVLASAMEMRADAIVSNDDDFKRAFNRHAGLIALRSGGKPLVLLDHREPPKLEGKEQTTLHTMFQHSLRRHYGADPNLDRPPRLGRPLWVDRRGGKHDWYLAYHHPLPAGGMEPSLVPGRDSISIIDSCSWTVCEVRSVYCFEKRYPEGITTESMKSTREYLESMRRKLPRDQRPKNMDRYFKLPEGKTPGYIRVAIALDGLPPSWERWGVSTGERTSTKRTAPKNALGFVEAKI